MSRSKSRLRVTATALGVGLLAVFALAAGVSQAGTKKYPTTLTASAKNKNFFDGQVLSVARCVAGRGITVYTSAGASVGSGVSDATGKWQVPLKPIPAGGYYASVTKRKFKQNGHKRLCRATSSPGFTAS
ncbi:MAG: hypothetical protein ACXWDQ_04905 [Solirubrobacterales bacterium]